MLETLRMYGRYSVALPRYLRSRMSIDEAKVVLRDHLARREESFIDVVRRGVFARPGPYRALMDAAGMEQADVERLVHEDGVEGSLARLYDAGVYVSLDEFQGRRPIRRGSFELSVTHEDFDNPLAAAHMQGRSGGSGGIHRRSFIDLDQIMLDAAARAVFVEAHGVRERPQAIWRPGPPDVSGLANILFDAMLGHGFQKWFVQRRHTARAGTLKYFAFTEYTRWAARVAGVPIPALEYTPLDESANVARWLADRKREGSPGYLDSLVSSGIRVCLAALELGLDVSGSFIRVGSEPFTPARAAIAHRAGCRISCYYAMNEAGIVGMGCAHPGPADDVHALSHKIAIVPIRRTPVTGGPAVDAFHLTTVSDTCPKLMLNVESGDWGDVQQRRCGCALGEIGLSTHLAGVRSYEKLTSEGMTFHGTDLLTLVDEVLPGAFGGGPTDYQFVEREENGLPVVSIVVSPRIGPVDGGRLVALVLERLSAGSAGGGLMSDVWRQAGTLRVERGEPVATGARKILPLHVERSS